MSARAAGLAVFAALLPFLPGWALGLSPFWGDLSYIHQPWRALSAELLQAGRLPLWNPYVYFGMPLLAQMQGAVLYPGTVPFFFFGFPSALAMYHAVHYALAALLMQAWLRTRYSSSAALLGGLAYALGGVMLSRASFINHLAVLSLWPAMLLFWSRPRLLALVLCLGFLAGYPPMLAGCFLAAAAIRRRLGAPQLLAAAGAAALSAALLVPALELAWLSRRAGALVLEEALSFGFSVRDLANWISPWLSPEGGGLSGSIHWWKFCAVGLIAAALALRGFLELSARPRLAVGAALAAIALLTLGGATALSRAVWESAPFLRLLRYPGNLSYLALPLLSLLMARGASRFRWTPLLVPLAALELWSYSARAIVWGPKELLHAGGPLVRRLQAEPAGWRYHLSPAAQQSVEGVDFWDWRQRLYGLSNAPFKISSTANFGEPLVPRPSFEFMDALNGAPSAEAAARLLSWAGAGLLLTPGPLPASAALAPEGTVLWRLHRLRRSQGPASVFPSASAIPEGLPEAPPSGARPARFQSAREDAFTVEGEGRGTLYLAQPLFPGWRATVNGAPAAPSRAALAFQKLDVPDGPWTVSYRYRPWSWLMGLWVSLAAWAAWIWPRPIREGA